jgi:hypothetical protein
MTYYIFLKSLRSLEEFRKNPHVKIPLKSPPTNFQSLAIIKNQIFIRKRIFLYFRPRTAQRLVDPSGLSAWPPSPAPPLLPRAAHGRSAHPGLRGLGVIDRSHLFFEFAQPSSYAFSLCHHHAGPTCQLHRLPRAARPRLKSPPRLTAIDRPAPPGLQHCDANQSPLLPRLDSPS